MMDIGLPVALVVGIDHFVAKAITRALLEKDMAVIGVGEEAGDLQSDKRFELRSGVNEVEETVAYVFDLRQETAAWKKAATDGAKLEVLLIDQEKNTRTLENSLTALRVNWRIFEVYEVYGVEMDLECSWVGKAIVSAVLNKPLTLPKTKTVRPVAVEDVVEAALRACFLSGTGEERLVYAGAEMETEEVGKILRREAKMTKEEVQREGERIEIERETVEESWSKLRWVPTRAFQESIEETLQYFFTIADEVGRKKPSQIKTVEEAARKYVVEEVVEKKKLPYEVVAEEETRKTEKKEEKEKEKVEKKEEGKLAWVRPIILPTTPVEEEEEGELVEEEEAKPEEIPKQETVPKIMATKNIEPTKPVATVQVTNLVTTPKRRSGVSWGKVLLGVTVGMVIAGVAVMGWVAWQVWQVAVSVQTIEKSIQQQNWQKATATTTDALGKIRVMEGTLMDWGVNGEINQGMRVVDEGLVVVNKAIPVMSEGQQLYESVFKDKEVDVNETVTEMGSNLDDLSAEMGILQARASGGWHWAPGIWKNKMSELTKTLEKMREVMQTGRKALTTVPELVGADGKRRDWLVLFQNEGELRPTGGFIGSYGVLSFENGKLLNLEVQDVYSADGQLKGHVEPPDPIKKYLGEAGWYMRDANWKASFPEASKDVLWFFNKETGRDVDGVVGIDLAVAKGLLGVVGEVYLPDYKEKVNKDNLYEQAEFYSEQRFFPGSHEKENFLGDLSKQLFEQIRGLPLQKQLTMISSLIDLADRNELQVATSEPKMAKVMADLGWDGAMYEGGCAKGNCLADYLYVVEANVGVNKANYFLYRNMEQMVEVSNASVARVVKINYQNTAKSSNWPGGDYKNYIRVYVPEEVNLSSVEIYDSDGAGNRTIVSGDSLAVQQVGDKKEIGFLVTIPVGKRKTVELRYSSSIDLTKEDKFSYLGYIQRQSGYGNTGLVSLVSYPAGWQPLQVEPSASIVANKLVFNQQFDRDIRMGVEIGK